MSDIDELIARIESASEGSGELSWAIAEMLGWAKFWEGQIIWVRPGPLADQVRRDPNSISIFDEGVDPGNFASAPPNYTKSIDAALTLVPDELLLSIKRGWKPGPWLVNLELEQNGGLKWMAGAVSDTGPLAICIASLKARKENG